MGKKKTIKEKPKNWWQKLLCELTGLCLIVFPLLVYISIFSYNSSDASFNKAASENAVVHNWLGNFGACSADFVLSTFGLAFIVYLLVPILWGIGLVRFQAFAEYKMRVFAWIVGLLCFSAFIDLTCSSFLGRFNLPYNLTGEWSRIVSRSLNNYINMLNFSYSNFLVEGIILFISILSFNFAAGITFTLWLRLTSRIGNIFKNIGISAINVGKRLANMQKFSEFKELNPSYLQNKLIHNNTASVQRVEPSFAQTENVLRTHNSAVVAASPAIVSSAALMSEQQNTGLQIEIPNQISETAGNLAVAVENDESAVTTNSYNPTFDFIKEGDFANQNLKKPSKKITPEDIYQTEGVRTFTAKKTPQPLAESKQEELLSMPSSASSVSALQTQQPAGDDISDTQRIEPTPVPDFNKSALAAENTEKKTLSQPLEHSVSPQKEPVEEYHLPDINLLSIPQEQANIEYNEAELKENAAKLETVLQDFGIKGKIVKVRPGPVVTLYELEPAPGTRTLALSDFRTILRARWRLLPCVWPLSADKIP